MSSYRAGHAIAGIDDPMGRRKIAVPRYRLVQDKRDIWQITWTDIGTRRSQYVSTGTRDRDEAERAMPGKVREIENPPAPTAFTIGKLIDEYIESRREHDHSATFEHNFARTREYFADFVPVQLRNDKVWQRYRNWRTGQHIVNAGALSSKGPRKRVSDSTAVRELNGLRGALSWAKRNGYQGLDGIKVHLPGSGSRVRHRFLSRAEVERLVAACIEPHTRLFVRISIATAARMSAVLGLRWSDVTFPANVRCAGPGQHSKSFTSADDISAGKVRLSDIIELDLGQGRGNKRRGTGVISPSNWKLWSALVDAHSRRDFFVKMIALDGSTVNVRHTGDFVISYRGNNKPLTKVDLTDAYRRAGITGATQHTLKHTCISWLVQAGQSYESIAKLVGTTARTIERHYGHVSPRHLATVGDVLSL